MSTERPTLPPPDLADEMRELRHALENVGELCGRLINRLAILELAELATEHRGNIHDTAIDDLKKRIETLEGAA